MKLVAITMIKNEADIIETFIRYHLQFVDRVVVVNHRSIDASSEIVNSLMAEGLPVELREEKSTGYVQNEALTALMREMARGGADWVIPLDADEFLGINGDLREILGSIPAGQAVRVPWRNYIPCQGDDSRERIVPKRIVHRLKKEVRQRHKILVPAPLALRPGIALRQGNHGLVRQSDGKKCREEVVTDRLSLAHFPVRSAEQITGKAFGGWLSALAKPGRCQSEAHHWRALYERFKRDGMPSAGDLTDIAIHYLQIPSIEEKVELVRDPFPLPTGFSHFGPERVSCDPFKVLAQTAEEIVSELAEPPVRKEKGILARLFSR